MQAEIKVEVELTETARGEGGFGFYRQMKYLKYSLPLIFILVVELLVKFMISLFVYGKF